jgi:hypothetical protein
MALYTKRDILFGRGGLANKHFGNKVYRRLIKHNKDLYRRLKSNQKRELLVKSILLAVESQGGRFLKADKATGTWHPVDMKEAQRKICQALREPERRPSNGDDASEDGTQGSRTSSSASSLHSRRGLEPPHPQNHENDDDDASDTSSYRVPPSLSPPKLARQYTAENPPSADRRIFDRALSEGGDEDAPYDEEAEAIAPTLLEFGASAFSLSGFAGTEGSTSGTTSRARHSFTYLRTSTDCFETLPPSQACGFGYGMVASYNTDCYNHFNATISPVSRSEPSASHPFPRHQNQQQQLRPHFPPPLPLVRAASSGVSFLGGIDELLKLDRQESTSSLDFLSFVANSTSV